MDIRRKTPSGLIEGRRYEGGIAYLGIPFALPPLRELTFKAPIPFKKYEGVYEAKELKCNPLQYTKDDLSNYSKDCLYLNIYVPEHEEEKKLPVLVWIYGGSYAEGGSGKGHLPSFGKASNARYFNGERLAADTHCIIVTFNYRLSLYGFLNLHFLDNSIPYNLGILDQICALKWVKKCISSFDGDDNNITLFGESAGGACILALMSSNLSKGLFNKAIVQSACIDHFHTEKESEKLTRRYLRYLGIKKDNLHSLIDLPFDKLMEANHKLEKYTLIHGDVRCAFSPIIDGETVPYLPRMILSSSSSIPLLIGTMDREASRFTSKAPTMLLRFYLPYSHMKVEKGKEKFRERAIRTMTDLMYKNPMKEMIRDYKGPLYVYNISYSSQYMEKSDIGSCHATDIYLLFDEIDSMPFFKDNKEEAYRLALRMKKSWSNFAYFSNPNNNDNKEWTLYKEKKEIHQFNGKP